jgi:hypothetical protein
MLGCGCTASLVYLIDSYRSLRKHTTDMKQIAVSITLGLLTFLALASSTPVLVRTEIDALLAKLQSSGCQFERNGSWYSAAEAEDHILRKFEYIDGKNGIQTTEQFIELAASKSSSSGKPYRVQCGAEGAIQSQQWLSRQLLLIRAPSAAAPAKK